MGDVISYAGTLLVVALVCALSGGVAAVVTCFGLFAVYWIPHNWLDWQWKPYDPKEEAAQLYIAGSCIFWARVAFALSVLYVLTEGCRDEVQRLMGPLLRFVDSF